MNQLTISTILVVCFCSTPPALGQDDFRATEDRSSDGRVLPQAYRNALMNAKAIETADVLVERKWDADTINLEDNGKTRLNPGGVLEESVTKIRLRYDASANSFLLIVNEKGRRAWAASKNNEDEDGGLQVKTYDEFRVSLVRGLERIDLKWDGGESPKKKVTTLNVEGLPEDFPDFRSMCVMLSNWYPWSEMESSFDRSTQTPDIWNSEDLGSGRKKLVVRRSVQDHTVYYEYVVDTHQQLPIASRQIAEDAEGNRGEGFSSEKEWTEVDGIFVPIKISSSSPKVTRIPGTGKSWDELEIHAYSQFTDFHFNWIAINRKSSDEWFDIEFLESLENIKSLLSDNKGTTSR